MLLLETCTFLFEITSGCNSRVALRNAHRLLRRSQQNPRSCLQSCCVKVVRSAGQAGLPLLAPSVYSPGELLSSPLTFFFHPKPGSKPILPPPAPRVCLASGSHYGTRVFSASSFPGYKRSSLAVYCIGFLH